MKERQEVPVIKKSHRILLTLLIIIVVSIGGYFINNNSKTSIEREKNNELKAITDLKIGQIIQWRKERIGDANVFSRLPVFIKYFQDLKLGKKNYQNPENIRNLLETIRYHYDYDDIALADINRNIVFTLLDLDDLKKPDSVTSFYINKAYEQKTVVSTNLYQDPISKIIHYHIIAPVNNNDKTIGFLIFSIDPRKFLFPLLQSWPVPRKTSETYIIRKEGDSVLFLNKLRFSKDAALKLKIPLTNKNVPAVQAVLGYKGIWNGKDYRNLDVLAYIGSIPGTKLYLISKVDKSEIYSELYNRETLVAIFTIMLILLLTTGLFWLYHYRQRNIYKNLLTAKKDITRSEEKFRYLFENSRDVIFLISAEGVILSVNPAFVRLTGWSISEWINKPFHELVHPDDLNLALMNINELLNGNEVSLVELRILCRSGDYIHIEVNPSLFKIGENVEGILGIIRDITERKHAEMKLRESEKYLKETQKIAKLGTYTLDIKTGIWRSSEILDTIFGIKADYNKSIDGWVTIIHPDWREVMAEYLTNDVIGLKNKFNKEYKIIRMSDKVERWIHGLGELVFNDENEPIKMVGTIRDVTEQRDAEEEINKLNRVYALLSNTNQAIVRIKDKQKLFDEICRIAIEDGKFMLAWIGLVNFETDVVDVAASGGDIKNYLYNVIIDLNDKATGQGPTGRTVKTAKHVVANDIENDEMMLPWKEIELELGYRSTAAFPLIVAGKVIGSFTLCSNQKYFFQEAELRLLDEMAMDISFALEFMRNESEREIIEQTLKKLSRAVEQSPSSVIITDPQGKIEYVNKKFSEVSGYSFDEVIGKNSNIVNSGMQNRTFFEELWNTILAGKDWKGEILNKKKNGQLFWELVLISPMLNPEGDIINFVGVKEDITNRKLAIEELRESEEKYRSVAESANDAIITGDSKGIILSWNNGAEKIFGYKEKEVLGKSIMCIVPLHHLGMFKSILERVNDGGENKLAGKTVETVCLHKNGSVFPVELSLSEWKTAKGIFYTGILRDITDRKKTEKELLRAKDLAEQSNKLKDSFIANMSHEIRTPLNGIIGMASLIKETFSDQIVGETKLLFEGVDSSSERLIRTVDMILNYSRLQVGEYPVTKVKIDLSKICENVILQFSSTAKYKSLTLNFENKTNNSVIEADEYSVSHVISNLVDNAIKYTNSGFVKIILSKRKNDDVILVVEDSGIGIGEDFIEHIFEPYRQENIGYGRAYEGVGLGLPLVKKFLDANSANINVESIKDKGTTFTINFGKAQCTTKAKD